MAHKAITTAAAAALTGAVLLSPAVLRAQTQDTTTTTTETQTTTAGVMDYATGFYAGGGIGESRLRGVCELGGATLSSCDDEGFAWKVYGGMQINQWLAAELGYISFGTANLGGTFQGAPVGGDVKTWGVTAHAIGQFPIPIGGMDRLSLLGKLGTIWYDRERNTNVPQFNTDDNGFKWAWGFGLQYTFSERIGVRAEWERFEDLGDSATGEGDADVWTVGLNYKF